MSRLRIEHRTLYRYRRAVAFGRHRLVLRPREGHDLQVECMNLSIKPAHRLQWARDVFSNSIALVDFAEPAPELEIVSTVIVRRSAPFPAAAAFLSFPEIRGIEYDVLENPLITAYQAFSYPDDAWAVRAWLEQRFSVNDNRAMLSELCSLIFREIRYQRRSAKGVQTPAETLKLGSGSCRDMATLMMEAARSRGLAARFASGYLDCAASEAGIASTHAWTEIYLPLVGWLGFDPTLGEPVSLKHIPVGVSQHPRGVMPVSGLFTGSQTDSLDMIVSVKIAAMSDETK
jgi:transglutaminase-like putative cysteine protease